MARERRKRIPRAVPLFVWCLLLFVSSIASTIPVVDATKKKSSRNSTTTTQSLKQRLQQCLQQVLEKQLQRVRILIGKQKKSIGSWPSPRVIDEFLSIEEAAQLIERYTPLLQQKSGFLNSKGQLNRASKYRSSSTVRVPPLGDPLMLSVERRAADAAQTRPHAYCEDFQLACYESGELYGLHRDDDNDEKRSADRIATVLVYLEAPELSQGGGETLFTHRSMEEESLKTEQGALKLFQSYCNRPKRKHQSVEPVVGRAVTWQNWYPNEKNETTFARQSTHGACPVREGPGRKCVIQQWIGKSKMDPLREECVAGIFPLGADFSYRDLLGGHTAADGTCVKDVSARGGLMIPSVCLGSSSSSERGRILPLDATEGPLQGVGAIQISGYGAYVSAPVSWMPIDTGSLTVSFWARKVPEGTALFSLRSPASEAFIQVRYLGKSEAGKGVYELRVPSTGESKTLEIVYWGSTDDWFWYSLAYDAVKGETSFSVYSSKHHMGTEHIGMGECGKAYTVATCNGAKLDAVRLLELPLATRTCGVNGMSDSEGKAAGAPGEKVAFVAPSEDSTPPPPSADLSFLIFHNEARTNESAVLALSKQARRYDISV
jgi:Rps23 Pro-64 3,4-dihydroxylase Tpa1-like proline 4-hydroxylase